MKKEIVESLRALATGGANRSKIGQLRELFNEIESIKQAGVKLEDIRLSLNGHGLDIPKSSFAVLLHRIRKEREKIDKAPDIMTTPLADSDKKNTRQTILSKTQNTSPIAQRKLDDNFVNPLNKIMEDYKKEQENNPRRDDINFNPVPDTDKIYGNKK